MAPPLRNAANSRRTTARMTGRGTPRGPRVCSTFSTAGMERSFDLFIMPHANSRFQRADNMADDGRARRALFFQHGQNIFQSSRAHAKQQSAAGLGIG